ncbi:pyruvate decarboxylase PdcB [Mucor mucedo]|uniref:pyruvate decarboxylase PdcB n=1 Tax=Mucor mucedo TaxID=29922 RepID=UPI00221F320A|nr:pyruvate decarboxylase PdcB [Mucor mucedo]KAI7889481.1 pyruvate decarboxylase PdcB [Mucor mucedo]
MTSDNTNSLSIGAYILLRLKQIGIDTVFGVPGDFNMPLLDLIEDDAELTWGNNANELNAAYAADGYARVRGMGAVVTAFGVGELSAINGIAGSYSEMVPVIHIVGTPRTASQKSGALLHHTLGNGDFDVFFKMGSMVTVAAANLTLANATAEVDRVILAAYMNKRPGYIALPFDLIHATVQVPVELPLLEFAAPKNPVQVQEVAVKQILSAISEAKHPVIIVDGAVIRHGLQSAATDFVNRAGFPTFSTMMGKNAIDETVSNYRGIYTGAVTLEGVREEIEKADLLIEVGCIKSDFNTGNFSYGFQNTKKICLNSHGTTIGHAEYAGVGMHELLPSLTAALPGLKHQAELSPRVMPAPIDTSSNQITHNYLWNKVPEYIAPNSIVVSETGTAEFGVANMQSPKGATFIGQILWGSIGYSVGAAVGAAFADRSRKVYLFVGDGSFQLTVQEISVFIRQGLTPVIFLLNNDGYLMEKLIHGPERSYNNFQMWDYSKTLEYFGGHLETNKSNGKTPSLIGLEAKVETRQEFENAMELVNQQPDKIHFLEVVMPEFDSPRELSLLCALSENR